MKNTKMEKTDCDHCWDEIPDNIDFHVGGLGDILFKRVKCSLCGALAKEIWIWYGVEEIKESDE